MDIFWKFRGAKNTTLKINEVFSNYMKKYMVNVKILVNAKWYKKENKTIHYSFDNDDLYLDISCQS